MHTSNTCHSYTQQNDQLFVDELKDVLAFLKMQETSYERRRLRKFEEHRRKNPNAYDGISNNLPPFYDAWRPVMVSWMYHVADTFRLMPIVVATGMYILDTCALDLYNASSRTYNQKELYPLMTMTALNMAVKCHETKMFPLDQLVQLLGAGGESSSDRSYTPDDVTAMERRLLHRCGWKLHCPTAYDFLLRYATVLGDEYKKPVTGFAVTHLKQSLLWEHIIHQNKQDSGFRPSTLAYAAFLLAMEDAGVPLDAKQAACLCLLEVAKLSAQTPRLSEAYNWLFNAKSLQQQLQQGNNTRRVATTTVNDSAPVTASTQQAHAVPSSSDVAVVEPDTEDESVAGEDDQSLSMMSYGSTSISDHSFVFCSHSSDGDSVEVISMDDYEIVDDDEDSLNQSTVTVLPTVVEEEEDEEPTKLVLTESLDEDGFEISFANKHTHLLSSLVASPRDVSHSL